MTTLMNGDGDLVIHPIPEKRGEALLQALSGFDQEFAGLLEASRQEQQQPQKRTPL